MSSKDIYNKKIPAGIPEYKSKVSYGLANFNKCLHCNCIRTVL